MAVIYLYGYLGKKYGRRFELSVNSVAEAVRLLAANFREFERDILAHKTGFLVRVGGKAATDVWTLKEAHHKPEIHIVPAIAGAGGKNGVGQLVAAAILVVAAYYGNFSPTTTNWLYQTAFSLAVSGVAALLFSTKVAKTDSNALTGESNLASYAFTGPINTTAQGNPVPVLYGRLRVGSQVISAGVNAE